MCFGGLVPNKPQGGLVPNKPQSDKKVEVLTFGLLNFSGVFGY